MKPITTDNEILIHLCSPYDAFWKRDSGTGVIISLQQFLNRVRYFASEGSIFLFPDNSPGIAIDKYFEYHASLFNLLILNLDECEAAVEEGLSSNSYNKSELKRIQEGICILRKSGFNYKVYQNTIRNMVPKNRQASDGLIDIDEWTRKKAIVIESMKEFASVFQRERICPYIGADLSSLSAGIKNLSNSILALFEMEDRENENAEINCVFSDLCTIVDFASMAFPSSEDIHIKCSLLSDELYKALLAAVHEMYEIDHKGLVFYIFEWCRYFLTKENYAVLTDEERQKVNKFYYLSVYFGGYTQNHVKWDPDYYVTFDFYRGFKSSAKLVSEMIDADINRYRILQKPDNQEVFKDTRVDELQLLQTSYYLRPFHQYSPMFSEMECTPILVNLFKAVEIFVCDLINKLDLNEATTRGRNPLYIKKANDRWVPIGKKDTWEDDVTLGELLSFIDWINQANGKDYRIWNKESHEITNRLKRYDSKMNGQRHKELMIRILESFENRFLREYGFSFGVLNGDDISPSKLLSKAFALWISKCRNANLHKHATPSDNAERKLEYCFQFTSLILAMLIDWFSAISK